VSIAPIGIPEQIAGLELKPAKQDPDIGGAFGKALGEAHRLEQSSTDAAARFAADDPSMGIHEVIIETEKSSIALRYATTLKNKALEAYRELMNTQV
jgi:flagellar hook-basal body complex protein FliE